MRIFCAGCSEPSAVTGRADPALDPELAALALTALALTALALTALALTALALTAMVSLNVYEAFAVGRKPVEAGRLAATLTRI